MTCTFPELFAVSGCMLSHIVNPDYLDKNIFPHMSLKMQRKMLTAISMHIQDQVRAEFFFKYAIGSNTELFHIELKFLRLMSEQSRLEFINKVEANWTAIEEKIEHVVRDSFTIAEACIQKVDKFKRDEILHRLRFLYSVSPQKYLDLLEKYAEMNTRLKYGLRISKNIATKHKNRILARPLLYLQKLDSGILVKHSTKEEVKQHARAWLPNEVSKFWKGKYCKTHKQLLKGIPIEERFEFVKGMFSGKYPGEEFETSVEFFSSESYVIMTKEQKLLWALQNFKQEKSSCNDNSFFKWYTILPFEMAFAAFKEEFVIKTVKSYEILIKACKSQSDLKQLFEYYLQNCKSEDATSKIQFVEKVRQNHKIFAFKEICWNLFQKLLLDHDVLELSKRRILSTSPQSIIVLYCILKKKEIPEQIQFYISTPLSLLKEDYGLTEAQVKKVKKFLDEKDANELKESGEYKESQEELCHKLKEDVDLVKPTDVKEMFAYHDDCYRLTKFLKKLKVYFPQDTLTQEYLKMFHDCLLINDPDQDFCRHVINFSVAGIFLLSNETDILISAHIPTSGEKLNWKKLSPPTLIKLAICQFAYFARPLPDPTMMSKYVTGHYVPYCSQILKAFAANLPLKLAIQFLNALFQSSDLKIKKKALKLAFRYFPEGLVCPLFLKVWETTTDKKFRKILYEAMSLNLVMLKNEYQVKMYKEYFRPMTLGLRKDELQKKIGILKEDIPEAIRGIHLQTLWELSNKLNSTASSMRTLNVIASDISFMEKDFMDKIVNDCIQNIGNNEQSNIQSSMANIAAYLIFYTKEEEMTKTRQLANLTMSKLIDLNINGTPSQKVIIWSFLTKLAKLNYETERGQRQYHLSNDILTEILSQLLNSIRFEDVPYIAFWEMKLTMIWNSTIDMGNEKLEHKDCDGKTVTKDLMQYYAGEVNGIMEALTATGRYSKTEVSKVAMKISDNLEELNLFLENSDDLIWLNFDIFFTEHMASFGTEEALVMGLHVLPNKCDLPMCALHYGQLLEKIKSFNYAEVQSMLRKKFLFDI